MKKYIVSLFLALAVVLSFPILAIASDTSGAKWNGIIQISNNGTAAQNVATVFTLNTTSMQNLKYINTNANNVAITAPGGTDVKFMPGYGGNVWGLFVSSIGAYSSGTNTLYTGGANMSAAIAMFTDNQTILDDSSIEPSDNFSITCDGYVDTSASSVGSNIFTKAGAVTANVTTVGEITANISGGTPVEYTTGRDGTQLVYSTHWSAQTFTPADDGYYTYVRLNLYRVGDPGTVTVSIRATSGSQPNGADLASTTMTGTDITTDSGGEWYAFSFSPPVLLSGSTQYAIVIHDTGANSSNCVRLGGDETSPSYGGGAYNSSTNSGASWSTDATKDMLFYIYSSSASVTATGLSSGEKSLNLTMDSPFVSLNPDGVATPPVTDNLVMNAPLWQTECSSSPFTTIDSNAISAAVTGATWAENEGYTFDNTANDYISLATDPALNITTENFTIMVWVKIGDYTAQNGAMVGGSTLNAPAFVTRTGGQIRLDKPGAAAGPAADTNASVIQGTWTHLAVVFDSTSATNNVQYYLNGTDDGGGTLNQDFADYTNIIGATSNGGTFYFDGTIGNVMIYVGGDVMTQAQVQQNYNATKSKYTSGDIYTYSTLASVPDNANDWILGSDATPYINQFDIDVAGINRCEIRWNYGSTFTDLSGNGNDATPDFIDSSSDPEVSATLLSFTPVTEADAPDYTLSAPPDFITTTPGASGNFTSGAPTITAPAWAPIREIAIAGAVPEQLIANILVGLGLLMLSFALAWMFKTNANNNLFIKGTIVFAAMCILAAVGFMDAWQIYFYGLMGIGIMWLSRQREAY